MTRIKNNWNNDQIIKGVLLSAILLINFIAIFFLINGFIIFMNRNNISIDNINQQHYINTDNYDYYGLFSFTDDLIDSNPKNWTILEEDIRIKDSMDGHKKVVEITNGSMFNTFNPQSGGIIELWAYPTSTESHLCFGLAYLDFGRFDFSIYVAFHSNGYLVYYWNHGWDYTNIVPYTPNKWYHLRFVFNCTTFTYDIYLNKKLIKSNAPFRTSGLTQMDRFRIHEKGNIGGACIDAIDYSWAPGYYIGRNYIYHDENATNYYGGYSFTNDTNGNYPQNWSVINGKVQVIESMNGHKKVVEFVDNSTIYNTFTPQSDGIIELWAYPTSIESHLCFALAYSDFGRYDFSIYVAFHSNGYLVYYWNHGWDHTNLVPYTPNKWYHLRFIFNCSSSSYDIYLNKKPIKLNTPFRTGDISKMDRFRIHLTGQTTGACIDAIDYSWAPGYYIGRNYIYHDENATNYYGNYSFTSDTNGNYPQNWSVINGKVQVIESMNGHKKVVEFVDNSTIYNTFTPQSEGIIELWAYPTSTESHLCFALAYLDFGRFDFSIYVAFHSNGYLAYYWNHGWNYTNIIPYIPNKWYHLRFVFNCTSETYDIYLNRELVKKDAPFRSSGLSQMDRFRIHLNGPYGGACIDSIDYSWTSNYTIGRNLYYQSFLYIPPPLSVSVSPNSWTTHNTFNISWIIPNHTSKIIGAYYKLDSPPNSNNDGIYVSQENISNLYDIAVPHSTDRAHTIYIWLKDNDNRTNYNQYTSIRLLYDNYGPRNFTFVSLGWIVSSCCPYNKYPLMIFKFEEYGVGIDVDNIQYTFISSDDKNSTIILWKSVDFISTDPLFINIAEDGMSGEFYFWLILEPTQIYSNYIRIKFKSSDLLNNTVIEELVIELPFDPFVMQYPIFAVIILLIITILDIGIISYVLIVSKKIKIKK